MSDLVSILVAVYNTEGYLERCISSILQQTYQNIEIILIDDGSTDKSPCICDNYALIDNRIRVIHQDNGGSASARNTGILNATGSYICFIDSDDYIEATYVERMYNVISQHNVDVVVCSYYKEFSNHTSSIMGFPTTGALDRETALCAIYSYNGFGAYIWNKMFKTQIIREYHIMFDVELRMSQDLLWTTQYFLIIDKIIYINDPLYHYMYNDGSICRNAKKTRTFNPQFFTSLLAHEKTKLMIEKESRNVKLHFSGRYINTYLRLILNLAYSNYQDKKLLKEAKNKIRRNLFALIINPVYGFKQKSGGIIAAISPRLFVTLYEMLERRGYIKV